ncbi:hypothetical protein Ct9H90mP29_23570 [bacterium]|nr:MAG: hypothetical protein Ct9H90mP29_23570 [bacterium]
MNESDLILFMVDGKEGPTASDRVYLKLFAKVVTLFVGVNKCDGYKTEI